METACGVVPRALAISAKVVTPWENIKDSNSENFISKWLVTIYLLQIYSCLDNTRVVTIDDIRDARVLANSVGSKGSAGGF